MSGRKRDAFAHGRAEAESITEADIDESLIENFPASDPPAWMAQARLGGPKRTRLARDGKKPAR